MLDVHIRIDASLANNAMCRFKREQTRHVPLRKLNSVQEYQGLLPCDAKNATSRGRKEKLFLKYLDPWYAADHLPFPFGVGWPGFRSLEMGSDRRPPGWVLKGQLSSLSPVKCLNRLRSISTYFE